MTTLKSNNNRLTSALQESTANVDEWKRQLHTYKEENLRLKREMDAMKPIGGVIGGNNEVNEDMRIEIIKLKSHIITLEKEIQELEIKASKSNVKDKRNEQSVCTVVAIDIHSFINYIFRQFINGFVLLYFSSSGWAMCATNFPKPWLTCAMYNKNWRKLCKSTKVLENWTCYAITM